MTELLKVGYCLIYKVFVATKFSKIYSGKQPRQVVPWSQAERWSWKRRFCWPFNYLTLLLPRE